MLPLLPSPSRFPQPDWDAIQVEAGSIESDVPALEEFWNGRGREWVHLLRVSLGADYRGYESKNFWLISNQPEPASRSLVLWAEKTRARVLDVLKLDHSGKLFGRCPMLVVHDRETYYEYAACYGDHDELAPSGGMFLNRGYGHFIFPFYDLGQAEAVLSHELAHSMVMHLPLPLWLNEGIAQLVETLVTGRDRTPYEEVRETLGTHWDAASIQDFWSGSGFSRDEGQLQCYHLALVLTRKLTGDMERFRAFMLGARADDAGADALEDHFGLSLEELVADYLGEGPWTPV